jgi:hypothetical protein
MWRRESGEPVAVRATVRAFADLGADELVGARN